MASSFDDARRERHARELEEMTLLLRFPFGCGPLVDSHRRCMEAHRDWRPCDALRDTLDTCVEAGERRRFRILGACSRWKRLYAACVLHAGEVTAATAQPHDRHFPPCRPSCNLPPCRPTPECSSTATSRCCASIAACWSRQSPQRRQVLDDGRGMRGLHTRVCVWTLGLRSPWPLAPA
ncbi:hypothetical protein EMIHUDRAFT_453006, partial [Emiliania huxleyi CCMP1516]|uniref:COX assembly mitochondrial protein n=2 Tax=Emiliania huxleyi TaxID=2903 RepID=A0A0D3IC86_EMIH1